MTDLQQEIWDNYPLVLEYRVIVSPSRPDGQGEIPNQYLMLRLWSDGSVTWGPWERVNNDEEDQGTQG